MSPAAASTLKRCCVVAIVAVAGLVLRVQILDGSMGALFADEAYSGLQSVGVIRDGRFPIVIDGNVYSAALEAYLFSPILVFAGGSIAVLKWLFVGVWAAAAVTAFGAGRRLMDNRAGAVAATLVWLAPGAMLVLSTRAYMGYSLGLAVTAGVLWAAAVVADRGTATARSSACLGFLAGLAFYLHPMFGAAAAPMVAVAAVVHFRNWRRWWVPAVGAALAANAAFIGWNAINGWPSLHSSLPFEGTYLERLKGFGTGLLPRAFGLRTFAGEWVFGRSLGLAVYGLLLGGVIAGCVVIARASARPSRWLLPVALAGSFPLMALLTPLIFVADGRYAIIVFPLFAIALGAAVSALLSALSARQFAVGLVGIGALWAAVTIVPFIHQQQGFESADPNAWQQRVIDRLDEVGITRVAGNYGLVLPIEYRSDQSIRVAIAGNPYVIRFPTSQRLVEGSPPDEVAFLFPPGDLDPGWFYLPLAEYRVEDFGGIILYLPPAAGR